MSEQRKVTKFMQAFQVPGLEHLDATVLGNPTRNQHFETAVAVVASQMTAKDTKNTGRQQDRTIAAFGRDTGGDDRDDRGNRNGRNGRPKKPPHKKHQKTKFNPKNPKGWIKGNKNWANLTPEQRRAATKAQAEAGIPTCQERLESEQRSVGALSTRKDDTDPMDVDEEESGPKCRTISMTQRKSRDISQHQPSTGLNKNKST